MYEIIAKGEASLVGFNQSDVSTEVVAQSGINYVLIKLVSRCNYDCSYCYWFRDGSVRRLPAFILDTVTVAFVGALERHIIKNKISEFTCSFHGGEPTLYSAVKLRDFMRQIDSVALKAKCHIRYALTTNGSLLSFDWLELISEYEISVTVSIDGPPEIHDKRRVSVKKMPTWHKSVGGYLDLCRRGVKPSVIAVCDPLSDPKALLDHFSLDLGVMYCDVLVPDLNHSDDVISIAEYYIGLFDHWYDNYSERGVKVRFLNEIVRGVLGLESKTDSIGYGPTQTVCLNTTGNLEPHDVLRIAGGEHTETECSIMTHEISDIERDPKWKSVRDASIKLCDQCNSCRYKFACGGGHISQRWSTEKQYDNPSVYCSDYIKIFDHVSERISNDLSFKEGQLQIDPITLCERMKAGVFSIL